MRALTDRFGWWIVLIGVLLLTGLACNLADAPESNIPPPPTRGTPAQPPANVTQDAVATPLPDNGGVPAPTFTPILGATATPRDGSFAPTVTPRGTKTATPTAAAATGTLSLGYKIDWRVDPNDQAMAIARVTLTATGGGGGYRYYHDELLVDGPVFEYRWATCRDNPGSFRVDSADGQSVRINYYEVPPCPR